MIRIGKITVGLAIAAGFGLVSLDALPSAHAQAGKKAFAGTGTGTIKGKVTLDGDAPKKTLPFDEKNKDIEHCKKGDTDDVTWVVGPGKGLANVVVFLKPPAGQYFKVDMSKKSWQDEVVVDQPFCSFKPHVSVLFAEYEGKPTNQKFMVKNSAPILHNSRVAGSPFKNPARGETLAAGGSKPFPIKADTVVVKINCDAHKWMEAFVWAFDHPYAAVSAEDGTFEIKNVPTGADLQVMAWHEVGTPPTGMEVKKGALKDGDTMEFKVKKK